MYEFIKGLLIIIIYFIICASIAIICRKTFKINNEVFRKLLHFVLLGSLFVFIYAYDTWWISVLTCISIILIAYPILFFFERFKTYSETLTERKKGELRRSLIVVFVMFSVVISVCFGWLNNKELIIPVVLSWGVGDAMAALFGKRFGKHKIYMKKSFEGSMAMFISSIIVVLAFLLLKGIVDIYAAIITSVVVSLAVTTVELFTHDGFDTITCPVTSLASLLLMLWLFGGIL